MCTVSVKVNEDVLRDYLPELENTAAIGKWSQMLIDARLRELVEEDTATMSIEEAREMTLAAVREEYAKRDMAYSAAAWAD